MPSFFEDDKKYVEQMYKKFPSLSNVFDVHKKVGEGTFSVVFLATLKGTSASKLFAIKHLVPTTHPKRIEIELQCLKQMG